MAFNEMIERLESERRDSARRALAAQEGERLRIARELHDEVGQALTAVVLQLERASARSTAAAAEVAEAREAVRASLEEVREIARRLRPGGARRPRACERARGADGRRVAPDAAARSSAAIEPGLPELAPEEELVVYRVAQEALTNVARHAGDARARGASLATRRAVELVVRDDGAGFDPRRAEGAGLLRHARARGARSARRSRVESAPGRGTTVRSATGARGDRPASRRGC